MRETKRTGDENEVEYTVYPYKNAEDWSDEERYYISSFLSALFLVNGRARVMGIAEKLTFCDTELDVFNLNYLMKTMGMLIARGEMREYSVCRFNLKNFSMVNSRIGGENGDKVMRLFIYRLKDIISDKGFVSRLGGDNFVMIFKKECLKRVQNYLAGTPIETGMENLI